MGTLSEAAERVEKAWCKGDWRKEEQSRKDGDTYCAAGALAASLIKDDELLTLTGEQYGPRDVVLKLDALTFKSYSDYDSDEAFYAASREETELLNLLTGDTYALIDDDPRAQMLARVIAEKNGDWDDDPEGLEMAVTGGDASEIIVSFNDADATTREMVVEAMREADRRYEEANG